MDDRIVFGSDRFSDQLIWRTLNELRDQRFEPFICYLKDLEARHLETLATTKDMTDVYRLQGRVAQLREILDAVNQSRGKSFR